MVQSPIDGTVKGAGIHAAADLLGHRDIRTAREYYVVRNTRAFTGLRVPEGTTTGADTDLGFTGK